MALFPKKKPASWKSSARLTTTALAATAVALCALCALSGCNRANTQKVSNDPTSKAAAVRADPSIPPAVKEEMLRQFDAQAKAEAQQSK